MQLSDLFVSHKQVEPVVFQPNEPSTPQPIYLNLDRAKKAASGEETEEPETTANEDMTTWSVDNDTASTGETKRWSSHYKDRNTWVTDMTNAYKKAGLSDNAIKNLLAKNALESGWGKSAQGAYNFGNITTGSNWKGRYVQGNDHNADGERISQKFRAYNSIDDYVSDEIDFLTRLYDFNQDDDFDTFIGKLQGNNKGKRRYAEDRQYTSKVKGVYNSLS